MSAERGQLPIRIVEFVILFRLRKVLGSNVVVVRKVGALIIGLAAIAVWFAMAPETGSDVVANDSTGSDSVSSSVKSGATNSSTSNSAINSIMTDDGLSQISADSAPKQTVVNGWTTRDLLEVIALQGNVLMDQLAEQGDQSTTSALKGITEQVSYLRQTITNQAIGDERPAALLVLGVLGLALVLFTSPSPAGRGLRGRAVAPSGQPVNDSTDSPIE